MTGCEGLGFHPRVLRKIREFRRDVKYQARRSDPSCPHKRLGLSGFGSGHLFQVRRLLGKDASERYTMIKNEATLVQDADVYRWGDLVWLLSPLARHILTCLKDEVFGVDAFRDGAVELAACGGTVVTRKHSGTTVE